MKRKGKKGSRLCRHNFLAIHSHKASKRTVIYEFSKLQKKDISEQIGLISQQPALAQFCVCVTEQGMQIHIHQTTKDHLEHEPYITETKGKIVVKASRSQAYISFCCRSCFGQKKHSYPPRKHRDEHFDYNFTHFLLLL